MIDERRGLLVSLPVWKSGLIHPSSPIGPYQHGSNEPGPGILSLLCLSTPQSYKEQQCLSWTGQLTISTLLYSSVSLSLSLALSIALSHSLAPSSSVAPSLSPTTFFPSKSEFAPKTSPPCLHSCILFISPSFFSTFS